MDWTKIIGTDPAASTTVILMLILIEGILSVDNAAVLATMVMRLPENQRGKALKYGIIGAYVFRGICLVLVAWLMSIWWLEPIGGLYLLYLAWKHFAHHETATGEAEEHVAHEGNWLYRHTMGRLGRFWATVVAVEIMDLAFSLDNVFAAVAFTKNEKLYPAPSNMVLVCFGVFVGILAMRFAAQGFVKLMQRFPFLEKCAYIVIAVLGVKLLLAIPRHLLAPEHSFRVCLESKWFDLGTSAVTIAIFVVPVLVHLMTKKNNPPVSSV